MSHEPMHWCLNLKRSSACTNVSLLNVAAVEPTDSSGTDSTTEDSGPLALPGPPASPTLPWAPDDPDITEILVREAQLQTAEGVGWWGIPGNSQAPRSCLLLPGPRWVDISSLGEAEVPDQESGPRLDGGELHNGPGGRRVPKKEKGDPRHQGKLPRKAMTVEKEQSKRGGPKTWGGNLRQEARARKL